MREWKIEFYGAFYEEFEMLSLEVQNELLANLVPLRHFGATLGRPLVDTLNGSRHANMKELRFKADDGVWRVAFAFDPERKAILLVAGNKTETSESRFYRHLIKKADQRFDEHLEQLRENK